MYLSKKQIVHSMGKLSGVHPFFGIAFLAFKKAQIPVGSSSHVVFSRIVNDILMEHFHLSPAYKGFYTPFQTSDRSVRWLAARYGTTSLQRIAADTFRDALIHEKGSHEWGWVERYVDVLQGHLGSRRIPAFHLAVWLFRDKPWPITVEQKDLMSCLVDKYFITEEEQEKLFDMSASPMRLWISGSPTSARHLQDITGVPPGIQPEVDAGLRSLTLQEIGPAKYFHYSPGERLSVITGDNSLGKTFILECIWWALSGEWLGDAIRPRDAVAKSAPAIRYELAKAGRPVIKQECRYDWDRLRWKRPAKLEALPGLVVYARFDGSFAVWDPALARRNHTRTGRDQRSSTLFMSRSAVRDGITQTPRSGETEWLCNGLIRDWVTWQTGGDRYSDRYGAFRASLERLSPSPDEALSPGEPTRLPGDAREIPTVSTPYGQVPIMHAAASVQRIVSLAYVLVWSWYEHLANSKAIRRRPQRLLILIVDEVEAHLHPRWQRVIVPAFLNTVSELSSQVRPQMHLATHSPLVCASIEPVFDPTKDCLFHLGLRGGEVVLEEMPFAKYGEADNWLMSPLFGLSLPRSVEAEEAIEDAKKLQLERSPSCDKVKEVHARLVAYLPSSDSFWPRWLYFARKCGVK